MYLIDNCNKTGNSSPLELQLKSVKAYACYSTPFTSSQLKHLFKFTF